MNRRQWLASATGMMGALWAGGEALGSNTGGWPYPIRQLTRDRRFTDGRPVFSPDGTQVLFERSAVGSNVSDLWIVPAAGGVARRFFAVPGLQATRADWSRATGEIAFTGHTKEGGFQLYFLNPRTGAHQVRRLKGANGFLSNIEYPSWYPDGRSVCVTNYGNNTLIQVPVTGGEEDFEVLTRPSVVLAGMSSVGPDLGAGPMISFAGQLPGKPYNQLTNQIWVKPAGRVAYQLDGKDGRTPWWSPNGQLIAFETSRFSQKGRGYRAAVQKLSGGPAWPISPPGVPIQHPKWGPEGSRVVFAYEFAAKQCGIVLTFLG